METAWVTANAGSMMELQMLVGSLVVALAVVTLAMWYLRRTTRQVIDELCQSGAAAEFWLRSTDVLAYSGAVMLVLMFSEPHVSWAGNLKQTLTLTLLGLFITVLFASGRIMSNTSRPRSGNTEG